jgi:hypothetical protein
MPCLQALQFLTLLLVTVMVQLVTGMVDVLLSVSAQRVTWPSHTLSAEGRALILRLPWAPEEAAEVEAAGCTSSSLGTTTGELPGTSREARIRGSAGWMWTTGSRSRGGSVCRASLPRPGGGGGRA